MGTDIRIGSSSRNIRSALEEPIESDEPSWPRRCNTTRWNVVLAAKEDDEAGRRALGELYQTYWYPVFAFIAARRGRQLAQELTQAFFVERILYKRDLQKLERANCRRFRSWLFVAVESFLKNHWNYERRQRRDVRNTLALDFEAAEVRFLSEPRLNPEHRFNRAWALCLLSRVIGRLGDEYCDLPGPDRERARERFERVKAFLPGPETEEARYRALAPSLMMSENAVKQLVFRLRQRFAVLLRCELRELVSSDEEVDAELCFLREALSTPPDQEPPDGKAS